MTAIVTPDWCQQKTAEIATTTDVSALVDIVDLSRTAAVIARKIHRDRIRQNESTLR